MEHTTYAGRLRYLDAADIDDAVVDFDGLDVLGHDDRKLGDIDGFIVDSTAGRVYYAVVDSGGWFTSRRFLLPIGHAMVDQDRHALRVDVAQDTLKRYPEFDEERFRQFSDEELRGFEERMAAACCPEEPLQEVAVDSWHYDTRRHYQQPTWWPGGLDTRERLRPVESGSYAGHVAARTERAEHEQAAAHSRDELRALDRDDVSPHLEGRAQPGDVLGIETGGERTYVGDTAEDENRRRRDADDSARGEDRDRTRDEPPRRG